MAAAVLKPVVLYWIKSFLDPTSSVDDPNGVTYSPSVSDEALGQTVSPQWGDGKVTRMHLGQL